jgi:hypothetical protein
MRSPLISLAVGMTIGAIARLAMAHGSPSLFANPFFPFFPSMY